MCGIGGAVSLSSTPRPRLARELDAISNLIAHRGPDGEGTWIDDTEAIGFVHRRLAVIDLSHAATQPMIGHGNLVLTFNGEIYNYRELRREGQRDGFRFQTQSDTETILSTYRKYGVNTPSRLRGMFAFAVWDSAMKRVLLARDRFGIKPLYFTVQENTLYFASEAKALLPFLPSIETDTDALSEYLTFQYSISSKTLFSGIEQLLPGHRLIVESGSIKIERYWDIQYEIDYEHHARYFEDRTRELVIDSVEYHMRSDVEVGAYVSGGVDSSLIAALGSRLVDGRMKGYHGRFLEFPGYDESSFAEYATDNFGGDLNIVDISADDFSANIRDVIWHLDYPVAGPGSFPQYMVSQLASRDLKVVLGGQGGDEVFGGYARYLVAYLEQCIKAAIDGTYKNGSFVVTLESIVPNLGLLREYKPLLREFWKDGLFGSLDERFLRLIDRSTDMKDEIDWSGLNVEDVYQKFFKIFNNRENVEKEAYFDSMTHFEFKTLLPALLQVEDRMSMAHGLESRVPLLDHPLIEFAATVPADIKFPGGQLKHLLKSSFKNELPKQILERRDKMGFPVPLKEWFAGPLAGFVQDVFAETRSKARPHVNVDAVLSNFGKSGRFSRKTWALLSLELWQQEFHDRSNEYRAMVK